MRSKGRRLGAEENMGHRVHRPHTLPHPCHPSRPLGQRLHPRVSPMTSSHSGLQNTSQAASSCSVTCRVPTLARHCFKVQGRQQ